MQAVNDCLERATAESSSLTRSFWYGKFLQHIPAGVLQRCTVRGDDNVHETTPPPAACELDKDSMLRGKTVSMHVTDAMECLQVHETSLSPGVFELVAHTIPSNPDLKDMSALPNFSCKDCTLNWPAIAEYLGEDIAEKRNCLRGAQKCGVIARQISDEISKEAASSLTQSVEENCTWTHAPEVFTECLRNLRTERPLRVHVSLLIGSAALERSLGDVYLAVSKAAQCPSLLRDLLATDELERAFSPVAMSCLRCLIGPPSGLNLRNILWHGFAAGDEIPEEYAYLLLVLVSSLGKALRSTVPALYHLTHRPYTTFPQEPVIAKVFEVVEEDDLAVVVQLFSHSYFILPTMLPTWVAAVEAFRMKRYGQFLALVLPALEHGMRRVFACVNGCPERAVTAESTKLYTTFDEILSPLLPSGEVNKLKDEIGVKKMEMLLDLLVHSEGPRLRDRVSHGEVDFSSLSLTLANHVLCVGVVLCAQYTLDKEITRRAPISSCLTVESQYTSLFHPISLLKREVQHLVSDLNEWCRLPDCCGEEEKVEREERVEREELRDDMFLKAAQELMECLKFNNKPAFLPILNQIEQLFKGSFVVHCSSLMELLHCVWDSPPPTLHMARQDMELTGILRRTVENAASAVTNIKRTAVLRNKQFKEKQLRSRQRANYEHLLKSLWIYQRATILLIILMAATTSHIPLDPVPQMSSKVIKFHKKVLQFAENFFSQTLPTRNRWEEAEQLCLSLPGLMRQPPLAKNHPSDSSEQSP